MKTSQGEKRLHENIATGNTTKDMHMHRTAHSPLLILQQTKPHKN